MDLPFNHETQTFPHPAVTIMAAQINDTKFFKSISEVGGGQLNGEVVEGLHDGEHIPRLASYGPSPLTLQDRLSHLDLTTSPLPEGQRSIASSIVSSRRPSLGLEPVVANEHDPSPLTHGHTTEDLMDISESPQTPSQEAVDDPDASSHNPNEASTAQSPLSQTMIYSPEEQPCRSNPDIHYDISTFLGLWRYHFENGSLDEPINQEARASRNLDRPSIISEEDVRGDDCDVQGIDWARLGTTREVAKRFRSWYHENTRSRPYPTTAAKLADSERFFRFRQMNTKHRAWVEHFELRNLLVSTSHNDIYYASRSKVLHASPSSLQASCAMDLTNKVARSADFHVTALAGAESMIIAGGYRGEYALRDLCSEYGTDPIKGNVSNDRSAMTNHIHTFTSRTSGYPQAVFCSNDKYVRSLDCQTNSFVNIMSYDTVCNCAATSPNGRLRLLVGDFEGSVIADVDSGRTLEHLGGHNAHGFACAWADDDIHVATAAQDCHILVWDARNWRQPVADIACEGTYATSLSFSPVGSGKRILVATEAADAVNIIDAETYDRKQVLDFFGDIAGTTLSADGSELFVSNSDREFGGLMSFQRTSHGNFGHGDDDHGMNARASDQYGRRRVYDWLPEYELDYDYRVRLSAKARRRRGLALHEMFT